MGKTASIVILATALLAGCATEKMLVATGGSRADGTVNLAYEYTVFEDPMVDGNAGLATAVQTCRGWDYTGAQPFGAVNRKCEAYNGYGVCMRTLITIPYQCTGATK